MRFREAPFFKINIYILIFILDDKNNSYPTRIKILKDVYISKISKLFASKSDNYRS